MRLPILNILAATAFLSASGCMTMGQSAPVSADYAAALADPARPAADRERDSARMPAELLAFASIRPGMTVGDYVMGGGYLTRILSAAVGANGHVYAFQPAEFIAFSAQYGEDQRQIDAAYANVDAVGGPAAAPAFPVPLDAIITVQNFHDLYLSALPADSGARASRALFAALKPGGILVVVDHSAPAGSGTRDADRLHRIDRAAVVSALTGAGFILDGESNMYARPADTRSVNVFDPAIRGHTDQFTLRFRKPG